MPAALSLILVPPASPPRRVRAEELQLSLDNIRDQRALVDRRALAGRLDAIAEGDRRADERASVLAELKSALAAGRAEVIRRFEGAADGRAAGRELSFHIDQLQRTLPDFSTTQA